MSDLNTKANLTDLGLKMDLLWTNENPSDTNGFAPQTVSLDLSSYKFVYIECRRVTDNNDYKLTGLIRIGSSGNIIGHYGEARIGRLIKNTSTQGIEFDSGIYSSEDNHHFGIPYQIYGVK